ncbi:MAG: diacylglycerol kinase family lipid kinase [Armatimonas sp.]
MSEEHLVTRGGVVIFNPTSGRGTGGKLRDQAKAFLGDGYEWHPTQRPGHATELAKEAAKSFDVVVAMGGDGTVGDVARGILAVQDETGKEASLGVLPAGTGNDYARNLGIPLRLDIAAEIIHSGVIKRVDVGVLNGTPFLNNTGTGFDSAVMQTMNSGMKWLKGQPAFLAAIFKTLPSYKPFTVTLEVDGEQRRAEKVMMISVLNGKVYGAGMEAAPHAEMDDGRLDVLLIKATSKMKLLPLVRKVGAGEHIGNPHCELFQTRALKISTIPVLPINIDGEIRGTTPMNISVRSRALKVLVR